jgi:hypothetical protein
MRRTVRVIWVQSTKRPRRVHGTVQIAAANGQRVSAKTLCGRSGVWMVVGSDEDIPLKFLMKCGQCHKIDRSTHFARERKRTERPTTEKQQFVSSLLDSSDLMVAKAKGASYAWCDPFIVDTIHRELSSSTVPVGGPLMDLAVNGVQLRPTEALQLTGLLWFFDHKHQPVWHYWVSDASGRPRRGESPNPRDVAILGGDPSL